MVPPHAPPRTDLLSANLRALAFYLPQFHPVAENDRWWGPGFTEWTNVVRGRPVFAGHHQPHLPADLGFYDLRCRQTRHDQARLARAHGIHGFCYYHYWFNGRLLLETPLLELLADPDLEFPFCVCWANENWTRRWDGQDEEVLIAQHYAAYDPDAHIGWLARAFRDPRYVRVQARPLFLVYRASDLPDVAGTLAAWRASAIRHGVGDLFICAVANSQNVLTPQALAGLGFDAVVEFEPNLRDLPLSRTMPEAPGLHLYDYRTLAERAMARSVGPVTVFPGVFPSWDNTARRGWRATIVQNDDATLYRRWLEAACTRAMANRESERLVFINAWNEWAEGCHLEPDSRHGRIFLEATAAALGIEGERRAGDGPAPGSTAAQRAPAPRPIDVRVDVRRPLYVWGSGQAGRQVAANLTGAGVAFQGFLDSDCRRWGQEVAGHPVHAPAVALDGLTANPTPPFILIGSIAQDAIGGDIERAGGRLRDHYLPDAATVEIHRAPLPAPGVLRLSTSADQTCPLCSSVRFTRTLPLAAGICQRCHSTERTRLVALVCCDLIDWAHPPLAECAPRQHVRVLHQGGDADHVQTLEQVLAYRRQVDPVPSTRGEFDLILVSAEQEPEPWVAYAATHLALGGHLVFLWPPAAPDCRADVSRLARAHGLTVGLIERDWPRHAVGPAVLWMCRRN